MLPYTPLHHLLLAPPWTPLVDDERQRQRRADRPPRRPTRWTRLQGVADLFLTPRPADPRRAATIPSRASWAGCRAWCGARAATFRSQSGCRWPRPRPGPRLWRRAEEHVRAGARRRSVSQPAPRRSRRASAPSAASSRRSATSSGCSISTPEVVAHDLHPAYRSTVVRAVARRRGAGGRAASPRPHRELPGRQRRGPARHRRGVGRHAATASTATFGAESSSSRTSAGSSARDTSSWCPCRAAMPRSASPGAWRPSFLRAAYGATMDDARPRLHAPARSSRLARPESRQPTGD